MGHRQHEILCIDDDEQSLKVRGILLESMGYRVLTEPDAERGLRTFEKHDFDAVIMDYQMPGMSGGDAAVEMKKLRPEVPVLIMSALPWLPDNAPREAIDDFIQKGEPLGVLTDRLEHAIAEHPHELQHAAPGKNFDALFGELKARLRDRL
jgi:DNA-binding NtrC family response regulator